MCDVPLDLPLPMQAPGGHSRDSSGISRLDKILLLLETSGTLGEPKAVPFTLWRMVKSSRLLASSMWLGLGIMPLHHVWGIACNLFAPLVSGGAWSAWRRTASWPGCSSMPSRGGASVRLGGRDAIWRP